MIVRAGIEIFDSDDVPITVRITPKDLERMMSQDSEYMTFLPADYSKRRSKDEVWNSERIIRMHLIAKEK